jgi:hypothetical protein
MNQEQVASALRIVVPTICTWLSANNYFSFLGNAEIVAELTTMAIDISAVVWGIMAHTTASKIQSVISIDPGIGITATQAAMDNHPAVAAAVNGNAQPQISKVP